MDRDVLATVLDRPVADQELRQAWLHDYRRVRAATTSYPLLVPAPGLVVGGVVFRPGHGPGHGGAEVRIRHFEEEEYAERWLIVQLRGGGRLATRVFFGLDVMQATDEPWDLAAWQSAHKSAFLEQCREWMDGCPAGVGQSVSLTGLRS